MVVVLTGIVVSTMVGTIVAAVVTSVVGGTVVAVVAGVVVDAVCVHPVTATSATRRIINPMSSFIWFIDEFSIIK
jgi:ABC-type glucose/galactose transport system permease subunit